MDISFHSAVIITKDLKKMKQFYTEVLLQEVETDFGNCIGFKCGLSLWQLQEEYPITKSLGTRYFSQGNKNFELCFETNSFNDVIESIKTHKIKYLHKVLEEKWGQYTARFYDPENNLIEIGESIPCFIKRFHKNGLSPQQISDKTGVPIAFVNSTIQS